MVPCPDLLGAAEDAAGEERLKRGALGSILCAHFLCCLDQDLPLCGPSCHFLQEGSDCADSSRSYNAQKRETYTQLVSILHQTLNRAVLG